MNENTQNLNHQATLACVSMLNTDNSISAVHSLEQRHIPIISPKGYYALPDIGDTVLLSSIKEPLSLGCLENNIAKILPGEIIIKNKAGAYIKLLNNGDIELNSIVISKLGEIISKGKKH